MEHWKLTIGNEKRVPVINLFYANSRYRFWTGKGYRVRAYEEKHGVEIL